MIGALIIVFREVIEAGIVVGIVMAVTQGIAGAKLRIAIGVAGGVSGAILVAIFAEALADALQGVGQELFNGSILAIAVLMLTWHNIWMASHGRQMAADMRQIGEQVKSGSRSLAALSIVVGVDSPNCAGDPLSARSSADRVLPHPPTFHSKKLSRPVL